MMNQTLEVQLANARAAVDEHEWLTEKLKDSAREARRLDDRVDTLQSAADKEQGDVESLEGFGLHSVLHTIFGG